MDHFTHLKSRGKKFLYFFWSAQLASSLAWGIIGYIEIEYKKSSWGIFTGKEYLVYIICLFIGALNVLIYFYLNSDKVLLKKLAKKIPPEKYVENIPNINKKKKLLSELSHLSDRELKLYSLISFQLVIICVCVSINNLISLVGLLLVVSEGSLFLMAPMLIISISLSIYMFPKTEKYLNRANELF